MCSKHFQLLSSILMRTSATSTLALGADRLATLTRRLAVSLGTSVWVDFNTSHRSSPPRPLSYIRSSFLTWSFLLMSLRSSLSLSTAIFNSCPHTTTNISSFTVSTSHAKGCKQAMSILYLLLCIVRLVDKKCSKLYSSLWHLALVSLL